MSIKKIKFFIVAATFSCSLFLFCCSGEKKSQEEKLQDEQDDATVEEMLKRDKEKMDSIKKELLKE